MPQLSDTLLVLGLATISLGTIYESDGPVERTFLLRNDGQSAICLTQGYTSCGCTTITFDRDSLILPGDTTAVRLHFNPRGKSGEFHESGIVTYVAREKEVRNGMRPDEAGTTTPTISSTTPTPPTTPTPSTTPTSSTTKRKHCTMALEGTCISSEESLARQFPVRATDSLWLSANRFDLGIMREGESKERGVAVLHRDEADRQELLSIGLTIEAQTPKGVQHIRRQLHIRKKDTVIDVPITFDVLVR